VDLSGSGYTPLEIPFEHVKVSTDFIEGREFLHVISHYQLLNKERAS
jgi:hypothetical protein